VLIIGFRYRGRTKGKGAWINWSWSEKNGIGISASAKAGPFTLNTGNGTTTKKRLTTNLPGGFYHVENLDNSPKTSHQLSGSGFVVSVIAWLMVIGICFITIGPFFSSVYGIK